MQAYITKNNVIVYKQTFNDIAHDHVLCVQLNRPETNNAFNAEMIAELTSIFKSIHKEKHCRAVVLYAKGKHFSAGADLNWMKKAATLSTTQNIKDAEKLMQMFESLHTLPILTIAIVHGLSFGGALGLIAACDYTIAQHQAEFCLSETKLGLLPAVILPYLGQRMAHEKLKHLGLLAKSFKAEEARSYGLIDFVCDQTEIGVHIKQLLQLNMKCSPEAQKLYKELFSKLSKTSFVQSGLTAKTIAKARTLKSTQQGLAAFFDKKPTPWTIEIPESWSLQL